MALVAATGAFVLILAGCKDAGSNRTDTPAETTQTSPDPLRTETGGTASEAAANASADALERAGDPTGHSF